MHSPVYRIGGDEFIVVTTGQDYENIKELTEQFRKLISEQSGEPWEKVSAAIGYAVYDGKKTADEVFKKADSNMYENKKEIKGHL